MTSANGNGNGTTIAQHRVRPGRLKTAIDAQDATLTDDYPALVSGLSELCVAIVRQARADARHVCSSACVIYDKSRSRSRSRRPRRECRADSRNARRFLARLRQGLMPSWMYDVALAARQRIASAPPEPYEPRIEKAPRHNGISEAHV